jgi:NADH-quinone oxidoreductase subunit M
MGGFAKVMPKAAVFFTIAGLSSLGLPGLAGFVAEFLVFLGAWESDHAWWAIPGILGAWITAVYVLRAIRDVFWGPGPAEEWVKANLHDARGIEWVALYTLGACLIIFGCYPRLILDFIQISTGEYLPALKSAVQVGLAVAQ